MIQTSKRCRSKLCHFHPHLPRTRTFQNKPNDAVLASGNRSRSTRTYPYFNTRASLSFSLRRTPGKKNSLPELKYRNYWNMSPGLDSSADSDTTTRSWIIRGILTGAVFAGACALVNLRRSAKLRSQVVGIIPARFASSRFEGKPLVPLLGKPMIQVSGNIFEKFYLFNSDSFHCN